MVGVFVEGGLDLEEPSMNTDRRPLYITTAIPFVNARPHLGFALELCIADAIARHARARGAPVCFATGTDDHSLKNVLAAERAGRSTGAFVAEQSETFAQLNRALEISADRFVQTSLTPSHAPAVRALWAACARAGDLYRATYRGLYCVGCERFAEPGEERCAEHAAGLELVEEDNWYFRLSRWREPLQAAIERGELTFAQTGAREETLAFLREPLRDLCVSRSAARARGWGLPVPGDPSQVIWVWLDALTYYLSALDFGGDDSARFDQFWRGPGRRVHVIGKGIARFHAVFWPAFLASAGLGWPSELLVHGYLTLDGEKISKSGRALDPLPLVRDFGADAVRYYLLRHVRTTRDGDFSHARFVGAYNAELANGLGNLANRVFGLVQRASGGVIPRVGRATSHTDALRTAALALPAQVDRAFADYSLDSALSALFSLVDLTNRTIDRTAPWALIRNGELEAAGALLRDLLETLRVIAAELAPFLPRAARELAAALRGAEHVPEGTWNVLPEAALLPPRLQLFPRWTDEPSTVASELESDPVAR